MYGGTVCCCNDLSYIGVVINVKLLQLPGRINTLKMAIVKNIMEVGVLYVVMLWIETPRRRIFDGAIL